MGIQFVVVGILAIFAIAQTVVYGLNVGNKQIGADQNVTAFAQAVMNGDLEGVKRLLMATNTSSVMDVNGTALTPLHLAVRAGNKEMIQLLLEAKADANAQDSNGWTVLHHLAVSPLEKQKALLLVLLAAGADPTIRNNDGKYPIHLMGEMFLSNALAMLQKQDMKMADAEAGQQMADIGVVVAKQWADAMFEYSIETGQKAIQLSLRNLLADGGADKALALAIVLNKPAVVKMLLDLGALNVSKPFPTLDDVVRPGQWPLHLAAQLGRAEIIELLAALDDADVDVQDANGWTPLHYLASRGRRVDGMMATASLNALLDANANPQIKNNAGQLPVDLAMAAAKPDEEIIGMLKRRQKK